MRSRSHGHAVTAARHQIKMVALWSLLQWCRWPHVAQGSKGSESIPELFSLKRMNVLSASEKPLTSRTTKKGSLASNLQALLQSCTCPSFHVQQTTWTYMARKKLLPSKHKASTCKHARWKTRLVMLTAFTLSQIASANAIVHLLSKHKEISLLFGGSFLMGKRD